MKHIYYRGSLAFYNYDCDDGLIFYMERELVMRRKFG